MLIPAVSANRSYLWVRLVKDDRGSTDGSDVNDVLVGLILNMGGGVYRRNVSFPADCDVIRCLTNPGQVSLSLHE